MAGKCSHCGAALRHLAQRTIDDTRLQDDPDQSDIEIVVDKSVELEQTDTDQGGATIELSSFFDLDEYRKESPPSGEQSLEAPAAEPASPQPPKTPTIPDRSDATMEFQAPRPLNKPASHRRNPPGVPRTRWKATRRSTWI